MGTRHTEQKAAWLVKHSVVQVNMKVPEAVRSRLLVYEARHDLSHHEFLTHALDALERFDRTSNVKDPKDAQKRRKG